VYVDSHKSGCATLTPLTHGTIHSTQSKYIVNVSAMEGKFYRHKTPFHPHTVCALASREGRRH